SSSGSFDLSGRVFRSRSIGAVLGAQQAMQTAAELERLAADDLKAVGQLPEAKQASRPHVLQAEIHVGAVRLQQQEYKRLHALDGLRRVVSRSVAREPWNFSAGCSIKEDRRSDLVKDSGDWIRVESQVPRWAVGHRHERRL